MGTFTAWGRVRAPFESADGWLDWVVSQSGGNAWGRTLDPIVAAFADEIGRIKDRMHQRHDSAASQFGRRVQQFGEAMADHWVDKANEIRGERGGGYSQPQPQQPRTQQGGQQQKPQTQQGAQQQKPQTQQAGQQQKPQTQQGAQQQKPQTAPQKKPATQPDPVGLARHSLLTQVAVCEQVAPLASEVANTANQLGHKYAALGGVFAAEAECLYAYRQVVSDAARALQVQAAKSKSQSGAITTAGIFDGLRDLRYTAYVLAWQLDLGYRTDAGTWPHDRIQRVLDQVAASQCLGLYDAASQALGALCQATWDLYDRAREVLDALKKLIDSPTRGYDGQDGAVPWGTHEVMAAMAAVGALYGQAMQYAGQPSTDDDDEAARDQAARDSFGVGYADLQAALGSLV
jgi:hypothetical protein